MNGAGGVERRSPSLLCESEVHRGKILANWSVEFSAGIFGPGTVTSTLCSPCHFLLWRTEGVTVVSERKLPVDTLTFAVSGSLPQSAIAREVERAKEIAKSRGYWTDRDLFVIRKIDSDYVIVFHKYRLE